MRRRGQFREWLFLLLCIQEVPQIIEAVGEGLLDRAQNINISQSEEETGSPGDFLCQNLRAGED